MEVSERKQERFDSKVQELDFLRLRVTELENELNLGRKVTAADKQGHITVSKSVPHLVGNNETTIRRRRRRRPYQSASELKPPGPMSADDDTRRGKEAGFLPMIDRMRHTRSDQGSYTSKIDRLYEQSKSEGNTPSRVPLQPSGSLTTVVKESEDVPHISRASFKMQRTASERRNLGQELTNGDILCHNFASAGMKQKPSKNPMLDFPPPIIVEEDGEQTIGALRNSQPKPQVVTVRKGDGRLAEHKSMQQFGVQPSEIVGKLRADGVISDVESRIVKALVDSDHVDMLNALFFMEREGCTKKSIQEFRIELSQILAQNVKRGEAKDQNARRQSTMVDKNHPLYRRASNAGRQLRKVAIRLNQLVDSSRPKLLIVGSGAYNPIHKLHLRMFYVARRFLEEHTEGEVVGGVVSPSHPTLVRQKYRTRPREIIPPRHRLQITKIAVGESSWLTVDPWEITRRRIMDYLSVLDHVASTVQRAFPHMEDANRPIQILYLCKGNSVLKLNPEMLREKGYGCVCVCRPLETDKLLSMMGKRFAGVAHVVEDRAILSHQLERTCSHRVRQELIQGNSVEDMTGEAVSKYLIHHQIGDKMSGRVKWNRADNDFSFHTDEEKPYANSPTRIVRPEHEMPLNL